MEPRWRWPALRPRGARGVVDRARGGTWPRCGQRSADAGGSARLPDRVSGNIEDRDVDADPCAGAGWTRRALLLPSRSCSRPTSTARSGETDAGLRVVLSVLLDHDLDLRTTTTACAHRHPHRQRRAPPSPIGIALVGPSVRPRPSGHRAGGRAGRAGRGGRVRRAVPIGGDGGDLFLRRDRLAAPRIGAAASRGGGGGAPRRARHLAGHAPAFLHDREPGHGPRPSVLWRGFRVAWLRAASARRFVAPEIGLLPSAS